MMLIAATVVYSLAPSDPTRAAAVVFFNQQDKLLHAGAFATLTFVLLIGLAPGMRVVRDPRTGLPYARLTSRGVTLASIISSFLAISALGLVIEIMQGRYTTTRTMDPWDVLANSVGSGLVCLLFRTPRFVAWRASLLPRVAEVEHS